jgi:ADP-ribose pyrophosphatase YjhB (NUDIX family)
MRYYIESDGRLYLVRRDGVLDLPERGEIPFEIEEIAPLPGEAPLLFCVPRLSAHPHDWPGKDEVQGRSDVSPAVREAVHATMPRVVVEGLSLQGGKVLLVKGSRGLNEGRWSLPGGFLRFGETPEEGVLREVEEEIGARARIERLLALKARLGPKSRLHWIMALFEVTLTGELAPDPDEISAVEYVPLAQAAELLTDDLMKETIAALIRETSTAGPPQSGG